MYLLETANIMFLSFICFFELLSFEHEPHITQNMKYNSVALLLGYNQSKKGCKDQESIQSSTTPDPGYQWESDKLTVDTTNKSQEVSPFPAGDHKAHINRRAQRHSKHKTEQKHKRSTKEVPPLNGQ